jgi:hypothetical protein
MESGFVKVPIAKFATQKKMLEWNIDWICLALASFAMNVIARKG